MSPLQSVVCYRTIVGQIRELLWYHTYKFAIESFQGQAVGSTELRMPKLTDADFKERTAHLFSDGRISNLVAEYVKRYDPELYEQLKQSFALTDWVSKEVPDASSMGGGIFMGKVVLWKLHTALHIDPADALCAITCTGDYEGGEAYFPDLGLKLRCVNPFIW